MDTNDKLAKIDAAADKCEQMFREYVSLRILEDLTFADHLNTMTEESHNEWHSAWNAYLIALHNWKRAINEIAAI